MDYWQRLEDNRRRISPDPIYNYSGSFIKAPPLEPELNFDVGEESCLICLQKLGFTGQLISKLYPSTYNAIYCWKCMLNYISHDNNRCPVTKKIQSAVTTYLVNGKRAFLQSKTTLELFKKIISSHKEKLENMPLRKAEIRVRSCYIYTESEVKEVVAKLDCTLKEGQRISENVYLLSFHKNSISILALRNKIRKLCANVIVFEHVKDIFPFLESKKIKYTQLIEPTISLLQKRPFSFNVLAPLSEVDLPFVDYDEEDVFHPLVKRVQLNYNSRKFIVWKNVCKKKKCILIYPEQYLYDAVKVYQDVSQTIMS
jgi:hypothetical protein